MPKPICDSEKIREKSKYYFEKHQEFILKSNQAYKRGDKMKAKVFSNESKKFKVLMDKENEMASDEIFANNNANKSSNEIDLHGLFVAEAIERLSKRISRAKQYGENSLIVIAGRGRHSENGPKIKPAVIDFAKKNRIQYEENSPNSGCILFKFEDEKIVKSRHEKILFDHRRRLASRNNAIRLVNATNLSTRRALPPQPTNRNNELEPELSLGAFCFSIIHSIYSYFTRAL